MKKASFFGAICGNGPIASLTLFAAQQREAAKPLKHGQGERDQAAQFSSFSPGTRSNSRVLLLTSVAPKAWAWAAIKVS